MTNEDHDEQQTNSRTEGSAGGSTDGTRVSFTLQGAVATSDHSHFHHHVFRHRTESQDKPVRFKDSRANEQAEKLREKLRERQLSGAAQNIPDTILVPCQGGCRFQDSAPGAGGTDDSAGSSSEDAADEVLQRLLSNITSLSVGSVAADSAVVSWDELDIEGCVYTLTLTTGTTDTLIDDVETPHVLGELLPGTPYSVSVLARLGTITSDPTLEYAFETLATEPSQPLAPRPAGATKSTLQVKWNAAAPNGTPITHYVVYWEQGRGDWVELARLSDRQYKVSALLPGTNYCFAVSAVNEIGESLRSEVGTCRTGVGTPNPPTCIYLGQSSETALTICWSPPNDIGGAEILGYSVEQETQYGFISVYDGELQECHIPGLARSTQYKFRVFSRNIAGQSKPSAVVMFTTRAGLPPPPVKVRVEGREGSDSVVIAWDPPMLEGDQQILRYNLKLSTLKEKSGNCGEVLEFHTTDDTKLMIRGLLPGTLYRILVTVVTAGGEGPSSPPFVFKTRAVCPSAPTPPTLRTKPSPYSLNLQWNPPSYAGGSAITRYTLEMYRDDWIQSYTGLETLFLVPSLIPGKSYKFRLRCHNVAGASLYSNTVNYVTGPAPPHSPRAPTLVSKGPYAASISWQESVTNGAPITSYSVEICLLGESFVEIYNNKGTECVARNLHPGSRYYCLVKANSAAGQSVPSQVSVYNSPPAPPEPPSKIHLVDSTDTTVTIQWTAPPSPGADILHYYVCFNGLVTKCHQSGYTAEGLNSDTQYKVRVQAVNSVGSGQFSSVKVVSTGTPLPPALTGPLQLLSHGHNFLKVGWTTSRYVKCYLVERRQADLQEEFQPVYEGNKNQVKIGKLTPNTDYAIRICGVNSAGLVGPWLERTLSTESVPPPPILKVNKTLKDPDVTIAWQVKDRLQDNELFQLFQSTTSDAFNPVYEGLDVQFTTTLLHHTSYSFKIRVKREEHGGSQQYGPFSQTILAKLKPVVQEKRERETETVKGESEIIGGGFEDYHVVFFILLALCLPAVLAVFYFVYF